MTVLFWHWKIIRTWRQANSLGDLWKAKFLFNLPHSHRGKATDSIRRKKQNINLGVQIEDYHFSLDFRQHVLTCNMLIKPEIRKNCFNEICTTHFTPNLNLEDKKLALMKRRIEIAPCSWVFFVSRHFKKVLRWESNRHGLHLGMGDLPRPPTFRKKKI